MWLSSHVMGKWTDLVYIDIDREKAYSQALDLDDAVSLLPHQITVRTGDYGDVEDADVIVMAAGVWLFRARPGLDMPMIYPHHERGRPPHMQGLQIPGTISISDIVADI